MKVKFFSFKNKSEDDKLKEINDFIKNKDIIDIKMTCTVDVDRAGESKHVQILVMYDDDEKI